MSKRLENHEHAPPALKESKCRRSQNEPAAVRQLIQTHKAKIGCNLPGQVAESNLSKVSQTRLDAEVLAVSEFQTVSSAAYFWSSTVAANKLHRIALGSLYL